MKHLHNNYKNIKRKYTLPFNDLKKMFLKEISHAHQGCVYMIELQ